MYLRFWSKAKKCLEANGNFIKHQDQMEYFREEISARLEEMQQVDPKHYASFINDNPQIKSIHDFNDIVDEFNQTL